MLNKRFWILSLLFLLPVATSSALTIGPAETKLERQSRQNSYWTSRPQKLYEKVIKAFLKEDFSKAISESENFLKKFPKDENSSEVSYLKALSLMKLGRFEEARPILQNLKQEASTKHIREQAAYSLGDSFYFNNQNQQAEAYYREALNEFPDASEADVVKKTMGFTSASRMISATALPQMSVEEVSLYSVQVGAFERQRNAERILNKLLRNRFDAFIRRNNESQHYQVRVGHLSTQDEAQKLEEQLKKSGYPTKIVQG